MQHGIPNRRLALPNSSKLQRYATKPNLKMLPWSSRLIVASTLNEIRYRRTNASQQDDMVAADKRIANLLIEL